MVKSTPPTYYCDCCEPDIRIGEEAKGFTIYDLLRIVRSSTTSDFSESLPTILVESCELLEINDPDNVRVILQFLLSNKEEYELLGFDSSNNNTKPRVVIFSGDKIPDFLVNHPQIGFLQLTDGRFLLFSKRQLYVMYESGGVEIEGFYSALFVPKDLREMVNQGYGRYILDKLKLAIEELRRLGTVLSDLSGENHAQALLNALSNFEKLRPSFPSEENALNLLFSSRAFDRKGSPLLRIVLGLSILTAADNPTSIDTFFRSEVHSSLSDWVREKGGTNIAIMGPFVVGRYTKDGRNGNQIEIGFPSNIFELIVFIRAFFSLLHYIRTLYIKFGFDFVVMIARPSLMTKLNLLLNNVFVLLDNFSLLEMSEAKNQYIPNGNNGNTISVAQFFNLFPGYWIKDGGPKIYYANAKEIDEFLEYIQNNPFVLWQIVLRLFASKLSQHKRRNR